MLTDILFRRILCLLLIHAVTSSHFLGGTINWRVESSAIGSSSVSIRITQTYSWTYTPGRCNSTAISTNAPVSGAGSTFLTCSPSCPTGFGSVSTTPLCTDVSSYNGIAVGQRSDVVVLSEGSNFKAIYTSSAWGTLTVPASTWSILTYIKLVRRSDNNMFNNAPVATVLSPINIVLNQKKIIQITVNDADGDNIRCRWASPSGNASECGTICPMGALPAGTILHSNCTIEITGTVINGLYGIALMIEDFLDAFNTQPLSSVPVQFLVQIINPSSCPTPPDVQFTGLSCTPLKINETFTSSLVGLNNCGESFTIIDISTVSFAGMRLGSLTKLSTTLYYRSLRWTPTMDQLGYQVMCAMALDNKYVQSMQTCFSFYITENGTDSCPGVTNVSVPSVPTITETTITTITTQKPIIACNSLPLFASLAGLLALTTPLNFYFLYRCQQNLKRKSTKVSPESLASSTHTVSTSTDSLRNMRYKTNYKPTVQRVKLTNQKIDKSTQNYVGNNLPTRISIKTIQNSLNESISSDPDNNNRNTSIIPLTNSKTDNLSHSIAISTQDDLISDNVKISFVPRSN